MGIPGLILAMLHHVVLCMFGFCDCSRRRIPLGIRACGTRHPDTLHVYMASRLAVYETEIGRACILSLLEKSYLWLQKIDGSRIAIKVPMRSSFSGPSFGDSPRPTSNQTLSSASNYISSSINIIIPSSSMTSIPVSSYHSARNCYSTLRRKRMLQGARPE